MIAAMKAGKTFTWTEPEGGDLASMRAAIKHGQTLIMTPVSDPGEIQVRDLVLVRWHQSHIFHIVAEIKGDQFLIVNSLGKVNGWVSGKDILGRVTRIIDSEPCPEVPILLDQLGEAYQQLIQAERPTEVDARRLLTIVDDLRWYAGRIGAERWKRMPRSNKWSFEQNLWRLVRLAKKTSAPGPAAVYSAIDSGKACTGLASEIISLFENSEQKEETI